MSLSELLKLFIGFKIVSCVLGREDERKFFGPKIFLRGLAVFGY
jgi:hypothetical protein